MIGEYWLLLMIPQVKQSISKLSGKGECALISTKFIECLKGSILCIIAQHVTKQAMAHIKAIVQKAFQNE